MTHKPKILIVDDVSSNIHLLMGILKEKYTIMVATSAKKALSIIQTSSMPDMILTDIVMPEMDGYELCKVLKSNKETAHIPVIFVTSLNSIVEQENGLNVGGIDFITKPFSREVVLHKVNTYLDLETYKQRRHKQKIFQVESLLIDNNKPNILLVDDSSENLKIMVEVLKNDYKVSVATSGQKALDLLEEGLIPELILLDVIMPGMNGYEVCTYLQSSEMYQHIPIIFVTVLEHEQDIVHGLELGAVDYVIKPIEPTVLNARIRTHLKLKSFQDELLKDIKMKEELIYNQSKFAILGEMFENITHQWKQPLSTIKASTTGMKLEKEFSSLSDESLLQGLTVVENSVDYLAQTVDDFRDFLQFDAQEKSFNLRSVVAKALIFMRSKFKNASIVVENNVEEIELTSYKNDLIQVLMNILSNAEDELIKKEGPRQIWIDSKISENKVSICIKDNAGGISEENNKKIFDKYFTTKSDNKGTGIGLYMSRKIAQERLHGDIKAFNEAEGACFEVLIHQR